MWTPFKNVNDINPTDGVIKLWNKTNYFNFTPWSTEGTFTVDISYLFFIPAGFIYVSKDKFAYNFGLKYVNKSEKVTGFVIHSGKRDLQEGKTEEFWHLEEQAAVECDMLTDETLKLPYLIVPDIGLPNYKPERRYFIPLGGFY